MEDSGNFSVELNVSSLLPLTRRSRVRQCIAAMGKGKAKSLLSRKVSAKDK
jgi:hypothetical protein